MTEQLQQDNVADASLKLTPEEAVRFLVERIGRLAAQSEGRIAMGLAGGPGVGKSTLAAQIVDGLNLADPGAAALVPMDGFHMRHKKLEELGTVKDKGAAHTFEGEAFVTFLAQLKAAKGPVSGPGYSRKIEDVVEDAFVVGAASKILVVEGNYLLLAEAPWAGVRPLLDLAVYIEVPRDKVRVRLLKRHAAEGLFTEARNREHVERVDLANYDKVAGSCGQADLMIALMTEF
jgi:pantothenate kinase